MAHEDFKDLAKRAAPDDLKHLILLKIHMDIKEVLLAWFIIFG